MQAIVCEICGTALVKKPGPGRNPKTCEGKCRTERLRALAAAKYKAMPKRPPVSPEARRQSASLAGKARWAGVSPEDRAEITRKAGRAKWVGVDPAKPKWKPKQERECPYCGELALMGSRQQQCGKNECRLARNAERMRVKYSHLTTAHKQRRRAQRVTTQTEVIRAAEIYDRDGWQCGICLKPVDPAVKYPNPMSVSLDHVTPLSLGGPHAAENVRCAHLICNVRRGNRVAIAT